MKTYKHRYIISYFDNVSNGTSSFGTPNSKLIKALYETDSIEEFNEMLELIKYTASFTINAVDTVSKKVLYTNKFDKHSHGNVTDYYEILEELLGDGKTIEDFKDPALVARDKMKYDNSPNKSPWCFWTSEHNARTKYEKYLKSIWGKRSSKKDLPSLKIYDDPHMPIEEVEALKKEEKEKINTIVERCGW